MPQADWLFFDDLDAVLRNGSPDKRVDMRPRLTDLFRGDADGLNGGQIGVFDQALVQPVDQIEAKTRAENSARPLHGR